MLINANSTNINDMKDIIFNIFNIIKRYSKEVIHYKGTLSQIHLFHYLIDTNFREMRKIMSI